MPTENRSSNTEMVSVPREHELKIRQTPLADLLSGLKTGEVRDCADREFAVGDTVLLREIDDARDYTGTVLRRTITHVQKHYGLPDHLCVLSYGQPAPQPHPDPIAWMVGTAFWWTKEEAERDAVETGLPIVGLGPMAGAAPAEQHQGEPVAWRGLNELGEVVTDWIDGVPPSSMVDLCGNPASFASIEQAYTHTAPGEVERLRTMLDQTDGDLRSVTADRDTLRAETDRLRQEVASIDKKLRGNVSDPDPLKPIMPGALSITTTYGLVAGIVRERDQLKKALERQS
ncbi:DUF3850 domain-containing protein [Pseudomonas fluorescens]|uniref:DUF3850 domain-containing protein n=1 Tax=Pseudomonas fluorescens TaxID=294 RepID=UPI0020C3C39C|nr:DUF3850 domain-containing protein [Pseudomonas fluorescens]UTL89544.1 DUF3850 domain-containing protein [Pseudomonas fluorescens]